jgi:DNA-binding transcriptional LysR family regulator
VRAAVAGLGIVQVPDDRAAGLVSAAALAEILGAFRPQPAPVPLAYPGHRQTPLRVRVLLEAVLRQPGEMRA